LFGHPARLHELRKIADENNIFLIEDNAQAILAEENSQFTGTIGHIGIFSLNYHKHINTGEGGAIITNSKRLAQRSQTPSSDNKDSQSSSKSKKDKTVN